MQRNLILTRDVSTPPPAAPLVEGLALHLLAKSDEPLFAPLDQMCVSNGFPVGWAGRILSNLTARALIAIAASNEAVAAGWLIREPFYIDEIRRSFDPRPSGDYYFGDFVAPAWRGRGLQRALIAQRLEMSHRDGRRWTVAMTRHDNVPSMKSYQAAGFTVATTIKSRRLGSFFLDRTTGSLPHGTFSIGGICLPGGLRIRRR